MLLTASKNKVLWATLAAIVLIAGVVFLTLTSGVQNDNEVECTLEAMICPDGSSVGRTGPSCEFTPCPSAENSGLFEYAFDAVTGATFTYPKALPTFYIEAVDWPPAVYVNEGPFTCTEAGEIQDRAGKSELRNINGSVYCVTESAEGAAGSVYSQYAYAFEKDGSVVILTFSTRTVQCGNYDEQQRKACEQERETFDLDVLIGQIAQTLSFQTKKITDDSIGEFWGSIEGTVFLGPVCPVVQYPPDPSCDDRPYETKLAVYTAAESGVVREFSSNASGKFSVELPPGEYVIRSAVAANVLPYCSSDENISVKANDSTTVVVYCDSGIR